MCHVFVVDVVDPGADELRTGHNADLLVGQETYMHICSADYVCKFA